MYLIGNGSLIKAADFFLKHSNRAFKYGDALFETIKVSDFTPLFIEKHIERLTLGMKMLKMDVPKTFSKKLKENILQLVNHNTSDGNARVRIQVFREAEGFYMPDKATISYLIEVTRLSEKYYTLNKEGLVIGVYDELYKPCNFLSSIKSCNSLYSILGSIYAKERAWDDCILINDQGYLAEGTASNFFLRKKNNIYTPGLDQGCVPGIMRSTIISLIKDLNFKISETHISKAMLADADEVFFTNAIKGVCWVKQFENKFFSDNFAKQIIHQLNNSVYG